MKKLVIFDLDGTLLDTIDDLGEAVNYALNKSGYPTHRLDSYRSLVGNGVKKLIERALPQDARCQETIELLLADFKSYYDLHNTEKTRPYDGIVTLLSELRDKGMKLAVASNKYHAAVEKIISFYFSDIPFVSILGQKDDVPVKPDPSIVFSILLETGIPKQDVLYVGDSGVDMTTAYRACVDSVGVAWGFRSEKELTDNFATHIVHTPIQILDIINS